MRLKTFKTPHLYLDDNCYCIPDDTICWDLLRYSTRFEILSYSALDWVLNDG